MIAAIVRSRRRCSFRSVLAIDVKDWTILDKDFATLFELIVAYN